MYVSAPQRGVEMVLEGPGRITTVMFYARDQEEGCAPYTGKLPEGLDFSMGRDEVRHLLGPPTAAAEARVTPFLGLRPPWDLFHRPDHEVHVEYVLDDEGIGQVTVSMIEGSARLAAVVGEGWV